MDDVELLGRFEARAIGLDEWTHRTHLRVAYLYLQAHDLAEAVDLMRDGIRRLNAANGVPEEPGRGYHETVTQAWMRVIDAAMRRDGGAAGSSDEFLARHPELLRNEHLLEQYTRERIMSEAARTRYLPPDKE